MNRTKVYKMKELNNLQDDPDFIAFANSKLLEMYKEEQQQQKRIEAVERQEIEKEKAREKAKKNALEKQAQIDAFKSEYQLKIYELMTQMNTEYPYGKSLKLRDVSNKLMEAQKLLNWL